MNSQEFAAFFFFAQFIYVNTIKLCNIFLLKLLQLGGIIHQAKFRLFYRKKAKSYAFHG